MTDAFTLAENKSLLSKNNLLEWIRNIFKLSIDKIEQACSGALYCQIIDACHPGKVKMNKVNWKAKLEHEYLNNYKILQEAFQDCRIQKNIEIGKLTKGKFNDNLEFLQWLKQYYDNNCFSPIYDAEKRRNGADLPVNPDNKVKSRENSRSAEQNNLTNKNNIPELNRIKLDKFCSTKEKENLTERFNNNILKNSTRTNISSKNEHRNILTLKNNNKTKTEENKGNLDVLKKDSEFKISDVINNFSTEKLFLFSNKSNKNIPVIQNLENINIKSNENPKGKYFKILNFI